MEALLFIIDTIAVILVAYWCVRNDKLAPDESPVGLFRFPVAARPAPEAPAAASAPPVIRPYIR